MQNQKEQPTLKTFANGTKEWRLNGLLHRLDGPAKERADGSKFWWQKGKLHRTDGPAMEYANGSKEWWQKGKRHRLDGPSIEWADGSKEWWINGENLSESKFNQRIKQRIKKLNQANQSNEKPISFFDSLIL